LHPSAGHLVIYGNDTPDITHPVQLYAHFIRYQHS
jgi:hypothetical protein